MVAGAFLAQSAHRFFCSAKVKNKQLGGGSVPQIWDVSMNPPAEFEGREDSKTRSRLYRIQCATAGSHPILGIL
jgi:hypothetical protein